MKKKLLRISAFFILFFIGIGGVKADMSCVYEMVPINYYVNEDSYQVTDKHYTQNARITYKGNSDTYTLTSEKHFDSSVKSNDFLDSSFNSGILKDKKCPSYINRTSKGNVDVINKKDFEKELKKFYNYHSKWDYPLVLVKQNGKETNAVSTLLSESTTAWTAIRQTEQYKNDKDITSLEKTYRTNVQNLSCKTTVSSNSNWKKYIGKMTDEKALTSLKNQKNNYINDYCSLYCSETGCKKQTNSTSKNECVKNCNKNDKPKCDAAYKKCSKIGTSTAQTKCIESGLKSAGLDSNYTTDRSKKIQELDESISKLRAELKKVSSPLLNVEFDSNGYKVKCSDVSFLHDIWIIIWIAGPVLTILFGTIDFAQAVIANDEQKMHNARKRFPKRLLATILLFLIPLTISIIVDLSNDSSINDKSLINCVVSGK